MTRPRSYGPKRRTKSDRDIAAFMMATITDETPVTEASFAAKVDALVRGSGR